MSDTTRYALVTGAGSGLGRAFCLGLAREGWHVAITDIQFEAARETLALLVSAGGSGQALQLDVTDSAAWHELRAKLEGEFPRLDLLINNAGITASGEVGIAPLEDFRISMDVNFYGVLNGCHAMIPWMKETASGGHIVNVASIFGLVAPPSMGAYCATKAAVVALSETLYGQLLPEGIGVTVVAPGFFGSQLIANGRFDTQLQAQVAAEYTRHARLTAEEIVDRTLFAVERRRLYVVLGRKARWIWRIKRWMPSRFAKLIAWRYRRKMAQIALDD